MIEAFVLTIIGGTFCFRFYKDSSLDRFFKKK